VGASKNWPAFLSPYVPNLNAMVGLKVLATKEWGFFLEEKYNRATISNFVASLAYHF
jgi:hypothetical protein